LSHNLLAATGPKDVGAVKSTAQNFEKIGRKSGINGVCYDKQTQCIIIRKKNNSDKGVQERLRAHSRSGRLQDERETERKRNARLSLDCP
jgi:hypothetical protein